MQEITWRAPEFEARAKGGVWYWGSIVIAALLLGASVWQRNFLFGVFIIIAEILLLVWGGKEPRTFEFTLNEKGVGVANQKSYPYADLDAFSVDENTGSAWVRIIFRMKSRMKAPIFVNAPRERLEEIRDHLAAFLPEKEW
ncbi:MAG: hypothetical protein AAB967_04375, partial [Patescibacteria group bacterium]